MSQLTGVKQKLQDLDRFGNPIIHLVVGNRPVSLVGAPSPKLAAHGQLGHKCYRVYPWQSEYWSAHVHTGAHDCPDGGCE